jgi:PAS domain S-box-containing protein
MISQAAESTPQLPTSHQAILDSIGDGVFTVDLGWRITSFNRAAERITGVARDQAIGQRCSEVFRASICESSCALRQTMQTGQPLVNRVAYILTADGRRVPISISTAILRDDEGNVVGGAETFRDLSDIEQLRKALEDRYGFADIIGRSKPMQKLFDLLPTIAESQSTVLIEGESGTGKELVARAIHDLSARADKPFVAVNCGALPDTLLESELFGHKAGAFTDARKDKPGRFALAEGGTIFLDEIGDVSPAMQSRLLRVLQERVYEPLGSVAPVEANVRVVAATNQDIDAKVKAGIFRQDLYYRINVLRLPLPPLRDRSEDIPLLVNHFVSRFNHLQGKDVHGLSDEALAQLMSHDFPGNVRELENIIERAFALCRCGIIESRHLPPESRTEAEPEATERDSTEHEPASMRELERRLLARTLDQHGGNRTAAARALSMHPSTFYRKARALGLTMPAADGRHRTTS